MRGAYLVCGAASINMKFEPIPQQWIGPRKLKNSQALDYICTVQNTSRLIYISPAHARPLRFSGKHVRDPSSSIIFLSDPSSSVLPENVDTGECGKIPTASSLLSFLIFAPAPRASRQLYHATPAACSTGCARRARAHHLPRPRRPLGGCPLAPRARDPTDPPQSMSRIAAPPAAPRPDARGGAGSPARTPRRPSATKTKVDPPAPPAAPRKRGWWGGGG
jgi:hypothetical protein